MVLGAVWCPLEQVEDIKLRIKEIKRAKGIPDSFELKWTKISPSNVEFYLELVNYFFDESDLHFRALIVPNKSALDHSKFNQTHDEWYYKMYFEMLKQIFSPHLSYRVYLDIKDTNSETKRKKLHQILCNNFYDYSRSIITRLQAVESRHVSILQLADVLLGAVSAANQESTQSKAKLRVIEQIRKRSRYSLKRSTLLREDKLNLFVWNPSEVQ